MSARTSIVAARAFVFTSALLLAYGTFSSPSEYCSSASTWSNCGESVQSALKRTDDLAEIVRLSELWNGAYERHLRWLTKRDMLRKADHDIDKIKSAINPINVAVSKGQEALLRRYFKQVARIVCSAIAEGALVFFDASSIASDYEELELMNRDLQRAFIRKLEPHLARDWKAELKKELRRAEPQLRRH